LLQTTDDPGGITIVLGDAGVEPPPLELLHAARPIISATAKLRRRVVITAPSVPNQTRE
jgi:hypothetical protein